MRTRRYIPGKMLLLLMAAAMLGGCTKEELGGGEPLPEGKYPLEFTSQMYGMEVTRATSANTWDGGEEIALKVAGSDTRKYTVSDQSTGKISAAAGVTPFYWTSTSETKTVSAYYPFALASASVITVKDAQNDAANYQASDALYVASTSIAFNAATKKLIFKHLPAKVVAHLKAGDGVTPTEVQGATVKFVSQSLTASFNSSTGAVTAAQPGSSSVASNVITTASGFAKSVQALLVPCQMQNKQFIEVTIGSDKFYYTPTSDTDGKLESGKVCTYEITVKRDGIEVKLTASGEWTNGGNDDVQSRGFSMKFRIDLTSYSTDMTYILPFKTSGNTGSYTLVVDWGDDKQRTTIPSGTDLTTAAAALLLTHTYTDAKEYTITINTTEEDFSKEQIPGFKPGSYRTDNNNNNLKLKSLLSPLLNTGETDFSNCFANCASLTSLLSGLFDYNTEVTNFSSCFALNGSTSSSTNGWIPPRLFAKHLKATNFQQCFQGQTLLLLNSDIFCEETSENMQNRFVGQTVNFANCFDKVGKDAGSGFNQTAPALWGYKKVSFTSTECFKDHHSTKVTNASSIPADWK